MTTPQITFLFPGQGSQAVGMGKELAEKYPVAGQTFDEADEALGYKLSQLCFEGPEEKLRMTEITQPAILTASVAAWRVLEEKGVSPSFVAGHSLGEYSAHVAAGTLSFSDAVRTVCNRGKYIAQGEVCQPANINSPEQIVISGHTAAVERAAKLASERGAKRAVMLSVSAPFHCSLMMPAQNRLAADLKSVQFQKPKVPVVCNVDAALLEDADASRDALVRQVTGAVKWNQSMCLLIAKGIQMFVEVGPGKVLCGLTRQIDRSKTCLNVGDPVAGLAARLKSCPPKTHPRSAFPTITTPHQPRSGARMQPTAQAVGERWEMTQP